MKGKLISIACMVLSIMLMAQSNGIAMTFASSPTKTITSYYSYFSPMPFGYANWCPIITAILSIVIVILLLISFNKNMNSAIVICLGLIVIASLLSWIVFGAFSITGLIIFALHIATFIIQITQRSQVK